MMEYTDTQLADALYWAWDHDESEYLRLTTEAQSAGRCYPADLAGRRVPIRTPAPMWCGRCQEHHAYGAHSRAVCARGSSGLTSI